MRNKKLTLEELEILLVLAERYDDGTHGNPESTKENMWLSNGLVEKLKHNVENERKKAHLNKKEEREYVNKGN